MEAYAARCHCGDVSLKFDPEILAVVQCHCQNCRQLNGADYSSWVFTKSQGFTLASGESSLRQYSFGVGSIVNFCERCATKVYGENKRHFEGAICIPLGIIQNWDESLAPQVQVYTEFKADWHEVAPSPPLMQVSG